MFLDKILICNLCKWSLFHSDWLTKSSYDDFTEETQSAENICLIIENLSIKYYDKKLKTAKTFKNQFGHASAQKLQKFVKSQVQGLA